MLSETAILKFVPEYDLQIHGNSQIPVQTPRFPLKLPDWVDPFQRAGIREKRHLEVPETSCKNRNGGKVCESSDRP